jgi:hypothetical protein
MSGTHNSPTGTLEERLRLGAGFTAADRLRILGALSALTPHLSGWEHDQVDLEVSLKDTEGKDQKVTLQAWLTGRAHLVATSHERDLDNALAEVRRDLIRQIEEETPRAGQACPSAALSGSGARGRKLGAPPHGWARVDWRRRKASRRGSPGTPGAGDALHQP